MTVLISWRDPRESLVLAAIGKGGSEKLTQHFAATGRSHRYGWLGVPFLGIWNEDTWALWTSCLHGSNFVTWKRG